MKTETPKMLVGKGLMSLTWKFYASRPSLKISKSKVIVKALWDGLHLSDVLS